VTRERSPLRARFRQRYAMRLSPSHATRTSPVPRGAPGPGHSRLSRRPASRSPGNRRPEDRS
jgi:hypothetical protein